MSRLLGIFILSIVIFSACTHESSNNTTKAEKFTEVEVDKAEMSIVKNYYVPVYSNILHNNMKYPFELTATLSIHNTNFTDSIYVFSAEYYNTKGDAVKEFVTKPILLTGMESINFVIESGHKDGGLGDNFVVNWGAVKCTNMPLIQTVMISTEGQQGISFVCDGFEIQ